MSTTITVTLNLLQLTGSTETAKVTCTLWLPPAGSTVLTPRESGSGFVVNPVNTSTVGTTATFVLVSPTLILPTGYLHRFDFYDHRGALTSTSYYDLSTLAVPSTTDLSTLTPVLPASAVSIPFVELTSHKDQPSGYAGLDSGGKLKTAEFPNGFTGTGLFVLQTSPTLITPNLGTPSAVVLTHGTGLPVSTGLTGLGTGVATWLATPTSANLAAAVTDETGAGALVFANSPNLVTPNLGVASATTINNIQLNNVSGGGGAIINIHGGKTFGVSNTLTFTGTDATTFAFPGTSDTVVGLAASQALTNKTVNGLTFTALTTGFSVAGGTTSKTLTVSNTITFTGTDATSYNLDNFLTASSTATLTNKSFDTAGTGNSFKINGVAITANTGTGSNVLATSPTLVTPNLGTPSAIVLTNATGAPTWNQNTNGTAANLSGTPALPNGTTATTQAPLDTTTKLATTAYVDAAVTAGGGGGGAVSSVFGRTGVVVAASADYTVAQVTGAAPLASPTLTGTPLAPTATAGTNTTQIATTAFVTTAVAGGGGGNVSTSGTITSGNTAQWNGTNTLIAVANTGTGSYVLATSPTLVTPVLGVATATSINKVALTAPATSATLTIVNLKTLTVNNSLTLAGTDSTTMTFPGTSDTVVTLGATQTLTAKTLTSPTMTAPVLGVATATTLNGLTLTALTTGFSAAGGTTSKTLTVSNTLTLAGTDSTTMTFPSTSASIARIDAGQTFVGTQTFGTIAATTFSGTPTFSGAATGLTATLGTNTTQLATTAFVIANATGGGSNATTIQSNAVASGTLTDGFSYIWKSTTTASLVGGFSDRSLINPVQRNAVLQDGATDESTNFQAALTAMTQTRPGIYIPPTANSIIIGTAQTPLTTGIMSRWQGEGPGQSILLTTGTNVIINDQHATDNVSIAGYVMSGINLSTSNTITAAGTQNLLQLNNANLNAGGTDVTGLYMVNNQFFASGLYGAKITSPICSVIQQNFFENNFHGMTTTGGTGAAGTTTATIANFCNGNLGVGYDHLNGQAHGALCDAADNNGIGRRYNNEHAVFIGAQDAEAGVAFLQAVTTVALTSNVATITATHNLAAGNWVVISGGLTTNAPLNGRWKIATVTGTTSFTIAITATNITSNSPAGMKYSSFPGDSIHLLNGTTCVHIAGFQNFTPAAVTSCALFVDHLSSFVHMDSYFQNSGGMNNDVVFGSGANWIKISNSQLTGTVLDQGGTTSYALEMVTQNGAMGAMYDVFNASSAGASNPVIRLQNGSQFAASGPMLQVQHHNTSDTGASLRLLHAGTGGTTDYIAADSKFNLQTDGHIRVYAGLTTAGLGTAPIIFSQNSSLAFGIFNTGAAVTMETGTAGVYRITYSLVITTTFVTNTSVTLGFGWTDDSGARTVTLTAGTPTLTAGTAIPTFSATAPLGNSFTFHATSAAITYTPAKTGTAATAGAAYVVVCLERIA